MTIDEAITLLDGIENSKALRYEPEHRQACQLGIEALKRVKALRRFDGISHQEPLPGETEE